MDSDEDEIPVVTFAQRTNESEQVMNGSLNNDDDDDDAIPTVTFAKPSVTTNNQHMDDDDDDIPVVSFGKTTNQPEEDEDEIPTVSFSKATGEADDQDDDNDDIPAVSFAGPAKTASPQRVNKAVKSKVVPPKSSFDSYLAATQSVPASEPNFAGKNAQTRSPPKRRAEDHVVASASPKKQRLEIKSEPGTNAVKTEPDAKPMNRKMRRQQHWDKKRGRGRGRGAVVISAQQGSHLDDEELDKADREEVVYEQPAEEKRKFVQTSQRHFLPFIDFFRLSHLTFEEQKRYVGMLAHRENTGRFRFTENKYWFESAQEQLKMEFALYNELARKETMRIFSAFNNNYNRLPDAATPFLLQKELAKSSNAMSRISQNFIHDSDISVSTQEPSTDPSPPTLRMGRNLLRLGAELPRVCLPSMKRRAGVSVSGEVISRRFIRDRVALDAARRSNEQQLLQKYGCSLFLPHCVLKRLLMAGAEQKHGPTWSIPFRVENHLVQGRMSPVVVFDKPLPRSTLTFPQRNTIFQKYAVRATVVRPKFTQKPKVEPKVVEPQGVYEPHSPPPAPGLESQEKSPAKDDDTRAEDPSIAVKSEVEETPQTLIGSDNNDSEAEDTLVIAGAESPKNSQTEPEIDRWWLKEDIVKVEAPDENEHEYKPSVEVEVKETKPDKKEVSAESRMNVNTFDILLGLSSKYKTANEPEPAAEEPIADKAKSNGKAKAKQKVKEAQNEYDYGRPEERAQDYKTLDSGEGMQLYSTCTIGGHTLMVRSRCDGHVRDTDTHVSERVSVTARVEYQPHFGAEQLSADERVYHWATALFKQAEKHIRVRVHPYSGEILAMEQLTLSQLAAQLTPSLRATAESTLLRICDRLTALQPGEYLLRHKAGEPRLQCFRAMDESCCESKPRPINMHAELRDCQSNLQRVTSSDFKDVWRPIDPNTLLQWHRVLHRAPCTFNPRPEGIAPRLEPLPGKEEAPLSISIQDSQSVQRRGLIDRHTSKRGRGKYRGRFRGRGGGRGRGRGGGVGRGQFDGWEPVDYDAIQ